MPRKQHSIDRQPIRISLTDGEISASGSCEPGTIAVSQWTGDTGDWLSAGVSIAIVVPEIDSIWGGEIIIKLSHAEALRFARQLTAAGKMDC